MAVMAKSGLVGFAIVAALALPSSALAVPFSEVGDAASTILGAQNLGTISGPNTITGALIGGPPTDPFDADVYKFIVTTIGPPRPVYISTFPGTTPYQGGGTLDTMLHLFSSTGNGIVANDDISVSNTDSYLTAMLPAGTYYLAISGFQYVPQDVGGNNIFPGLSGPGMISGTAGPLHHFTQLQDQGYTAGPYEISVLVPEPGALLALAAGLLGLAAWPRRKTE